MSDAQYMRQLGFYNPADRKHDHVTFVGIGGIGSFAALGVAKLGVPSITLVDPDYVEEHNQPNQFYRLDDIGKAKAEALENAIAHEHVDVHIQRSERDFLSGIVVSGLDSMESRKEVWEQVKLNPRVKYYLDGRLGGQIIVLYAVNPLDLDDCEEYEKTLHSDEEGVEVSCTERGIIDVGLMVGSIIARAVRRIFNADPVDAITVVNQESLIITTSDWIR